jgi:eukaryotic-like serine/threonine-protein kinase
LAGRYRLLRLIGEGGVGVVWEAESALFGRVAVKFLRPHLAGDPSAVERFAREARAAATIAHANVVTILDLGSTSENLPFFVMELCDGETLDVSLAARGAVGVGYAVELVSQVLSALDAAHALGIVHRDLKPGNVMVVHPEPDRPLCKVLDFGIAVRVTARESDDVGKVFGTPAYMAPEQIMGALVDPRADIYAAGAMLYELCTGRAPFSGRNEARVMSAVLQVPPKPMRAHVRTLPPALDALVRRCLAKLPAERPATARALRDELAEFAAPVTRARVPSVRRQRKKSEPLPLVRRAPGEPAPPTEPGDALPLVKRADPDAAKPEPRRAVLELVHDSIPDED